MGERSKGTMCFVGTGTFVTGMVVEHNCRSHCHNTFNCQSLLLVHLTGMVVDTVVGT